MMLGMIGMNSSMRASGEGMYTEGDYSLIGQTQEDITGNGTADEVDEEDVEERENYDYEDNEEDDTCETPLYRQSCNKELSWYQRLFENALTRFMGIRV